MFGPKAFCLKSGDRAISFLAAKTADFTTEKLTRPVLPSNIVPMFRLLIVAPFLAWHGSCPTLTFPFFKRGTEGDFSNPP
jgi:hypothetical protein